MVGSTPPLHLAPTINIPSMRTPANYLPHRRLLLRIGRWWSRGHHASPPSAPRQRWRGGEVILDIWLNFFIISWCVLLAVAHICIYEQGSGFGVKLFSSTWLRSFTFMECNRINGFGRVVVFLYRMEEGLWQDKGLLWLNERTSEDQRIFVSTAAREERGGARKKSAAPGRNRLVGNTKGFLDTLFTSVRVRTLCSMEFFFLIENKIRQCKWDFWDTFDRVIFSYWKISLS